MKPINAAALLVSTLMITPALVSVDASASQDAAATQQANADLDSMAQDIARLVAEPGFRGFLRSEMAKSKNREGILELDKFLERASRGKGTPPGLAKFKDKSAAIGKRVKASKLNSLQGFDLYIPVEAHRAKWKGGADLLVASSPLGDEADVREIIAYNVKTGKKVTLDPDKAPDIPVLVLVPEEHDSHEPSRDSGKGEPMDPRKLSKPDFDGEDAPDKPVAQEPGNSYFGIHRLYIRDVKEPWTRGRPEIKVFLGIRGGNYCKTLRDDVTHVNSKNNWYTTWDAPRTTNCSGPSSYPYQPCMYFDGGYSSRVVAYIYEQDGGDRRNTTYNLYSGVSCSWSRYSGDDYVDHGTTYLTNFPFNYDYYQYMGNASVKWHKVH